MVEMGIEPNRTRTLFTNLTRSLTELGRLLDCRCDPRNMLTLTLKAKSIAAVNTAAVGHQIYYCGGKPNIYGYAEGSE